MKSASEGEGDDGGGDSGGGAPALSLADLMPKVDISGQIKAELIKELGDKNWKVRGEGLQKVQEIVSAAKFIQPSLGELPAALKARLGDSNKNLVSAAMPTQLITPIQLTGDDHISYNRESGYSDGVCLF